MLDKAIEHGHEHRKPYRGAKAIDKSCRNHGGDDWSVEDRTHKYRKRIESAEAQIDEYERGDIDTDEDDRQDSDEIPDEEVYRDQ